MGEKSRKQEPKQHVTQESLKDEEELKQENIQQEEKKETDEEISKADKSKAIIILEKIEDFFLNILDKIKLKSLADLYRNHREGWRYLIFGALATVVNIAVYSVAYYWFYIENAISNMIAWVVAAIFAYLTNRIFVFESKVNTKKGILKEMTSFFSCRLFTLLVDEIIMIVTVDNLGWSGILMKIVANIVVIVLNFVLSKLIIFKKEK